MAGLGRKVFTAGQVLAAADVQGYLQDQSTMVFANSTVRGTAIGTAVSEGMMSYLLDTNQVEIYDGSTWRPEAGCALIYQNTFPATSSLAIDYVFTTQYDNYLIVMRHTLSGGSGAEALRLNLRAATANASTDYYMTGTETTSLSGPNRKAASGATFAENAVSASAGSVLNLQITQPATAIQTLMQSQSYAVRNSDGERWKNDAGVLHGVNAAYDGIRFVPAAGTISGSIRIYGMRNI